MERPVNAGKCHQKCQFLYYYFKIVLERASYCGSVDPTRTLVAREAGYVSRSQVPLGSGCAWPPTHASITHDVDARSGAACRALPFKRTAPPWAPRPQLLLAENWLHSLHMPALTAASRARQLNNPANLTPPSPSPPQFHHVQTLHNRSRVGDSTGFSRCRKLRPEEHKHSGLYRPGGEFICSAPS